MAFYNNQDNDQVVNPKPQTAKKAQKEAQDNEQENYFAVLRQPTYLEKRANPNIKSIVSKIIDTRNPYRNLSPEDFGIEKTIENDTTPNILTIDGAKNYKQQQQKNQWFTPTKKKYNTENSLYVTDNAGDYLFKLKGKNEQIDTITAKELYKEKKQWFAPEADHYMPITNINDKITENKDKIKKGVEYIGGIAADGTKTGILKRLATMNPDTSNSYDNHMIKNTLDWAEKNIIVKTQTPYTIRQ